MGDDANGSGDSGTWSTYEPPFPGDRKREPEPEPRGPKPGAPGWKVYEQPEPVEPVAATPTRRRAPLLSEKVRRLSWKTRLRLVAAIIVIPLWAVNAIVNAFDDGPGRAQDYDFGAPADDGFTAPRRSEYEPHADRYGDGPGELLNLDTVRAVTRELRALRGDTLVTEATFYRDRVVLEVPDGPDGAVRVYVWEGAGLKPVGHDIHVREPVALASIDPQLIVDLGRPSGELEVEDLWVIVRHPKPGEDNAWLTSYEFGWKKKGKPQHYLTKANRRGLNEYLAAW